MPSVIIKKVAHLTFDMQIGGAEQVILNLVAHSDSSKFDVSILCLEREIGPFGKHLIDRGFSVISFGRKPGLDFQLIRKIRQYVIRERIDVIHCHQYTPYIYGLFASLGTSLKIIFTEHGRFFPDKRKPKRVWVNPILSLLTQHVTAISVATGKALAEFENFPPKKIKVIYNGIDDGMFLLTPSQAVKATWGIPSDAFVLGTVARLDRIKNQELMLKALGRVLPICPDCYLLVIGDGPERERLESLGAELHIDSHLIFTGFRQDTHHFYKIMDVFLLTSFSEGTAMTLLEAMASSVPCIVTEVGGNPEIIKENETGCIIPDNDEDALVRAILKLYEDRGLLRQMGQNGRMRFEKHFTVDKMIKSYEELYVQ